MHHSGLGLRGRPPIGHCFIISLERFWNKPSNKNNEESARKSRPPPLWLCQNETAFWFSHMRPSMCGTSAGRRSALTCRVSGVFPTKAASLQRKIKRAIIQFYQIHPRVLPPPPHSHFVPAFLGTPLISLTLWNVSPSCVSLPSAVMRTAAVARNTNCYLTLCLCFFPASHGSLGPLVYVELHSCSNRRKELVDLTKQGHR